MSDVKFIQVLGEGGDVILENGVVELSGGLETSVYLSLFGGNLEDPSWWGDLLETNDAFRYPSKTQRALGEVALTSGVIPTLEGLAKADLNWMILEKVASKVEVDVSIPAVNRVEYLIEVTAEGEQKNFKFTENWQTEIEEPREEVVSIPAPPEGYVTFEDMVSCGQRSDAVSTMCYLAKYGNFNFTTIVDNIDFTYVSVKRHPVTKDIFIAYPKDNFFLTYNIMKIDANNNTTIIETPSLASNVKCDIAISAEGDRLLFVGRHNATQSVKSRFYNTQTMALISVSTSSFTYDDSNVVAIPNSCFYIANGNMVYKYDAVLDNIICSTTAVPNTRIYVESDIIYCVGWGTGSTVVKITDTGSEFIKNEIIFDQLLYGIVITDTHLIILKRSVSGDVCSAIKCDKGFLNSVYVDLVLLGIINVSTLQVNSDNEVYFSGFKDGTKQLFQLHDDNSITVKNANYGAYGKAESGNQIYIMNKD